VLKLYLENSRVLIFRNLFERRKDMWVYITVALAGIIVGFFLRMIQSSIHDVKDVAGVLNIVKVGDNPEDLLLELDESPGKLSDGQLVTLYVRATRR
jgi:hypothetical protein